MEAMEAKTNKTNSWENRVEKAMLSYRNHSKKHLQVSLQDLRLDMIKNKKDRNSSFYFKDLEEGETPEQRLEECIMAVLFKNEAIIKAFITNEYDYSTKEWPLEKAFSLKVSDDLGYMLERRNIEGQWKTFYIKNLRFITVVIRRNPVYRTDFQIITAYPTNTLK